jgi:hypothetical protein
MYNATTPTTKGPINCTVGSALEMLAGMQIPRVISHVRMQSSVVSAQGSAASVEFFNHAVMITGTTREIHDS